MRLCRIPSYRRLSASRHRNRHHTPSSKNGDCIIKGSRDFIWNIARIHAHAKPLLRSLHQAFLAFELKTMQSSVYVDKEEIRPAGLQTHALELGTGFWRAQFTGRKVCPQPFL